MFSFLKISSVANSLFLTLLAGFFLLAFSSCTKEAFTCEACADPVFISGEESEGLVDNPSDSTATTSSIITEDIVNP